MSSPEIVFALAPGQNAFFAELAEALAFEIARAGGRARVAEDEFPAPHADRVHVLMPPHEFVALAGFSPPPAALRRCVLISAEPPGMHHFWQNLSLARRGGAVLDINPRAVRAYRAKGIPAEHLRLGYSERWDRAGTAAERDIDVLFLGRLTERRGRLLASYADVLERFDTRIVLSDNSSPNTASSPSFVAGEEKLALLARAKVILNVHGEEEPYFEWLRVAEAICCGCAIVSEHATDAAPLVPFEHYAVGRPERLGLLAAWLADDAGARERISGSARELLRREVPLSAAAETLCAAARRAARNPVSRAGAREARVFAARAPGAGRSALQPPPDSHNSPGEKVLLRALKSQHGQLLTLRRQIAAGQLASTRPADPVPRVRRLAATRAWERATPGALTVCVPLFNQGETLRDALGSLLVSTRRDWELVVVDDASTDGSTQVAERWLRDHPDVRALLVRHEVNRGLPHARNTAVRYARADRVFMLDSDNAVRRRGLERLMAALDADPTASFAYSILDRFSTHGAEGVLSAFGWEPERFRSGNYIDAQALIRREALLALGGYSTDPRLFGWEDYDLWVRMAEHGHHGAFVPQMLGRYRVGATSMISITNVSAFDGFSALVEHAPNLMRDLRIPG